MQKAVVKSEIPKTQAAAFARTVAEEHEVSAITIRPCLAVSVEAKPSDMKSAFGSNTDAGALGELDRSLRFFGCDVVTGEMR